MDRDYIFSVITVSIVFLVIDNFSNRAIFFVALYIALVSFTHIKDRITFCSCYDTHQKYLKSEEDEPQE